MKLCLKTVQVQEAKNFNQDEPKDTTSRHIITKTAKVIKIAPKESDFLYVRNRAVSAGNVIDHGNEAAELIPIDEFYVGDLTGKRIFITPGTDIGYAIIRTRYIKSIT